MARAVPRRPLPLRLAAAVCWTSLACAIAAGFATTAVAAPRVVLIGVDGGTWNVIDPLIAAGEMPHLEALMARGVHANLATVEPVNSPTVWTAMATGQPPAVNGIASFLVDERDVGTPRAFEWPPSRAGASASTSIS